jgi:hypothetical protein
MTLDDWLRIAQIISTLTAPLLAKRLLERERNTSIETPETNQPKRRVQLIADWIADKPRGFWFWFLFLIGLGVLNVVSTLRYDDPLDKGETIGIIVAHVTLAFLLVFFFTVILLDRVLDAMSRSTRRTVDHVMKRVDGFTDRMAAVNDRSEEALANLTESMNLTAEALKTLPNKTSRLDQLIELMKRPFSNQSK